MTRLATTAATILSLTTAAMEEASRQGLRDADIDHLLLALTLSEQPAGQVLRGLGVTLDAAREAVSAQHAAQLASLGVAAAPPRPGRITFPETDGYRWSDRAMAVIDRASRARGGGDASAVLRELLREPSGMIAAVLRRLGTTADQVAARLDEADRLPAARPAARDRLAATVAAFVPASPQEVRRLLTDPARLPEWDTAIARVDGAEGAAAAPGARWTAWSPTEHPDGRPIRRRLETARIVAELRGGRDAESVAWRFTFPDLPRANARRIEIAVEAAASGSQLRVTAGWERNPAARRAPLLPVLLRPLTRLFVWQQAQNTAAGISRALRH